MNAQDGRDEGWGISSQPGLSQPGLSQPDLESPFLDEELFSPEPDSPGEAQLAALEAESPFGHDFELRHDLGEGVAEEECSEAEGSELDAIAADEAGVEPEGLLGDGGGAYAEEGSEGPSRTEVVFPSGESLRVVTGLPEGETEDYWDPTNSGNPVLDTGPAHKDKKLSANLTVRELTTSGGRSADHARIDPKLVECVQRLREHVGKAVRITSGYRSWKRNQEVGGKKLSQHLGGRAVDIKIQGMNGLEIAKAAIDACGPDIGVGLAFTFAHLDVRGYAEAWKYGQVSDAWVSEIKSYQRAKGGRSKAAAGGATKPQRTPPPAAARPAQELVRFAQRVLNAAENERLADDGDLGPLTRVALTRFRQKYGLGAGGLDAVTELALVQRALEELAQASLFARPGVRDAVTDQAISAFKARHGLGLDARLDAATRKALTDALARLPRPARNGAGSSGPAAGATVPATPGTYQGGRLWTFGATAVPTQVAVFCPPAALAAGEVDVLLFAHGLLSGCPRPRSIPAGFVTDAPFRLGDVVARSGRPVVLAVPFLDWAAGGERAFGSARRKWHALGKPSTMNGLVAEVLAEVGRVLSRRAPALRGLMIAGHSRAYDLLEPLAHSHTDPQMQQGALARLTEVWALDSTYGSSDIDAWMRWLQANPALKVTVVYRPGARPEAGATTWRRGDEFHRRRGHRLTVIQATEGHCAVPATRLPALLTASGTTAVHEAEAVEQLAYPEPELDVLAFEAMGGDGVDASERGELAYEDVAYGDAEYGGTRSTGDAEYEDAEYEDAEYEDADLAYEDVEGQVEEETAGKSPLPVPAGRPIPFAPAPPTGSYWPVRTTRGRTVSYAYQAPAGTRYEGTAGRRFLADRGTARYHVGVDLFADVNDVVVACEPGTIVGWQDFLKAQSGQQTRAILIEHDWSGIMVNYGEVTPDSLSRNGLEVGMRVAAGQPIGWVSDTSMLHFETYVKGTTKNARWLKADRVPPAQLLNPTRYLLFLKEHGLTGTQGAGLPAPGKPAAGAPSAASKSSAELVGFAQRVLNVAEGERLTEDGILGRNTRGALERFRKKHGLGAGGTLDARTELALAQRALEETRRQSLFGQMGVLDAVARAALATFKSERGLGANADLDAPTRAALAAALTREAATSGPLSRILQVAADSEIARYRWRDRGVAPRGYIKGMALVYARVYCSLRAGDPAALEMAKANTGNGDRDALAHFAAEFRAAGMNNDTSGVDTLRHLFVLLIGLGMRESSGRYCAGRDRSASNTSADTAEAGPFQTSFNARGASSLLPGLFRQYLTHPSGFLDVFREGVRCSGADLENFGSGDGREFQRLSKESPAFAAEFTAIALRNRRKHWGPINRKAAEIRPECDAMLLQVQRAVDQFGLCPAAVSGS